MAHDPRHSTLQRAELGDGAGRDVGQAIPGHPGEVGAGAKLQEHGTARLAQTLEACVPQDRLSRLACERLDGPCAAEDGRTVNAGQNGDAWGHKGALFEPACTASAAGRINEVWDATLTGSGVTLAPKSCAPASKPAMLASDPDHHAIFGIDDCDLDAVGTCQRFNRSLGQVTDGTHPARIGQAMSMALARSRASTTTASASRAPAQP